MSVPASPNPLTIALTGATGRMGRMIAHATLADPSVQIIAASTEANDPHVGEDLGRVIGGDGTAMAVAIKANAEALFTGVVTPQVLIDFTTAPASMTHVKLAADRGTPVMLGTTGHNQKQGEEIRKLAKKIPIAWCANTSIGVAVLSRLVEETARVLADMDWDIEIGEVHHKHKIDAPSGTALALGRAAAKGQGKELDHPRKETREGRRPKNDIGFAVMRGGDVAGEHSVLFLGECERLELTHRANDRVIFAKGAITAAKWIADPKRKPGLYTMADVLGLGG